MNVQENTNNFNEYKNNNNNNDYSIDEQKK